MTPPWGVPATVAWTRPSTMTPAVSQPRTSFCTRRSDTRCSTSPRTTAWSIGSKKLRMSASATHRPPGSGSG